MANGGTQIIDNLALIPLTQTEVLRLNLQSLGVITLTTSGGGGGGGDMAKAQFATINSSGGFVDKAITANQVPYSGLTALPGGTVLFLRADGTFSTPPGQIYNVVTIATAGLVPVLPASSGFNYFLRGDGSWQLSSTLSSQILYGSLSGLPSTFTATAHQATHITGGTDVIPSATTTKSGLVPPVPPGPGAIANFLRGDSSWQPIPNVTGSSPGFIPNFPGTANTFFSGVGIYSVPSYALLTGIPSTFAPSAHAISHITSVQDPIPNFAIGGPLPGLTPGSTGGSVNYLRADGTWNAPPGGGGLATNISAGLMSQLPPTAQITYYWGGDNLPHLISGLIFNFSQITPASVPIFAGSSSGLVPTSAGGSVNFLRADGIFAAPAGGTLVTTGAPGLVTALPSSTGGLYYLNGLDVWTLISTLPIDYFSQVTGKPSTFAPSAHASSHFTGGTDVIGPATVSRSGLVPVLPSSTPTLFFLRGDSTFAVIPIATGSTSGLVPTPPNSQTQWFRADATFQTIPNVTSSAPGFVQAFPGNTTTFLNGLGNFTSVDYTNAVSGKPSTFSPSAHATSHITGGADQIPVFTSSATGLVPIAGSAGTYLGSNGLWTAPSGSGNVLNTRQILTQFSLTGGGDLSADRTHNLVGDVATPSNSSYYGTNSSGTRGWFTSTSQPVAITGTPGLVPTPTGSPTVFLSGAATFITPPVFTAIAVGYVPASGGGSINFLRADGWFPLPTPGLATTVSAGVVPSLNSIGVQSLQFLRGDDTWQLISGVTIDWSQLTNKPVFSGTTTNGLVNGATAGIASMFLSGNGSFLTPPLAASAISGYIAGLPSANATNFWARGDNSWQILPNFVVVSTPWTMPAIGSSTPAPGVTVNSTSIFEAGMTVLTGSGSATSCFMEVAAITNGTQMTLKNQGYAINPVAGTSIPGGLLQILGPGVANSGVAGFVPTPTGLSTQFLNGTGQWAIPPGAGGISSVITQFSVTGTGLSGAPIQLANDIALPGPFKYYSTDAIGTLGWFPLNYAWETNLPFSMPGIGAIQTISLVTNAQMTVGSTVVIEDNTIPPNQGFFEVISINGDGTHVVVNNRGYAFNSPGGVLFATAAAVTLAGPGVAASGIPGFVPRSLNDTVTFLRADGTWQTPANVQIGISGYVPAAPGISTQFLNGNGLFSTPSVGGLAITGTQGAVQGLPSTNQSTSFLRGDNTWQLTSTISSQIVYASIPGTPTSLAPIAHRLTHISTGSDPIDLFSTTTAVSGLVVGSNSVGTTFFLRADGAWATPPSGPGLAISGTSGLVAGLVASPTLQYLRGDNSWQLISGLAIPYANLTGTVPFATTSHGATHLDNGSDPIAVVAGLRTGLVPVLPAASPTTKFLRGDATWTVIPNFATNAVTPGLVVGSNSVSNTNFLRADNTWNGIQAVSTSSAGLAPALPVSNGTSAWLRGDSSWVNIPFYWTINASFTQPAISSTQVAQFVTTAGQQVGMCIATVDTSSPPVTNYYTITAINVDGVHSTLMNLGATGNTAAFSTVNAGQCNLNGPPIMTSTGAGIAPVPTGNAAQFLCANASWVSPPTTGVPLTRNINTQYSLTGGGQLNADLTLNLVNDTASPGNSFIYGTTSSGTRGWQASNSFPVATTTNNGLAPQLPTSTPTTVFLRGDGTYAAPSGLALASGTAAGIVPQLPAVPPATPTQAQWLRADNSWQFLPDSNVTTASWQMPAVGSTVPSVQFNATTNWDVGMTLFFATGDFATCCYMEVTSVNNGLAQLTLSNRGYQSNPASGTTIPTCMVFVVSPGKATIVGGVGFSGLVPAPPNLTTQFLRGDATWNVIPTFNGLIAGMVPNTSSNSTTTFLRGDGVFAVPAGGASTTAGAIFSWPAYTASTASILVGDSTLMIVGSAVYVPGFGVAEVISKADATHVVLRNNGNFGNATGGTVGNGTTIAIGTAGAKATSSASGMIPIPPSDTTKVLLGDATFGTLLYSSLGSIPSTPPLHASTHVTGGTDIIGPATTSVTGLVPLLSASNNTNKWLRGDSSWVSSPPLAITTVAFTWPASGGTVPVTVDSTALMHVNMGLYAPGLGVCEVTVVTDGTHMTIRNNNNTGNAGSTASQTPAWYVGGSGAVATSTSSGLLPLPTGSTTTFLNANAAYATPPSVSTGAPGYAPTAPANGAQFLNGLTGGWTTPPTASVGSAGYVLPPGGTTQFLRADATWAAPVGVGTVVSTSFTFPAASGSLSVNFADTSEMLVGSALLIVGFGTVEVTAIGDSTHATIRNNLNKGNAISGTVAIGTEAYIGTAGALATSTASGMIPVPPGNTTTFLNGNAAFSTPPSFVGSAVGYVPISVGGTVNYLRADGTWAAPVGTVSTGSQSITGTTTLTLVGDVTTPTNGQFYGYSASARGWFTPPAATATVSGYVPTPPNNTTTFLRGDATFTVLPANSTSSLGTVVSSPNDVNKFYRGDSTWDFLSQQTETNGTFTVPAAAGIVAITVVSASWTAVGQTLWISDGTNKGFFEITVRTSATAITIKNQGYLGNSVSGTMATSATVQLQAPSIATATQPGFVPVPPNNTTTFLRGDANFSTPPSATATVAGYVPTPPNNTYQYLRGDATFVTPPLTTVTTGSFTQVAIGSNTASIAVESSSWMAAGMVLIVGTGSTWNYMTVVSKADATHCVLTNIQGSTVSGTIASGANIQETSIPIVSATNAGIVPIPPNVVTQFLNGQGAFSTPPSATSTVVGYVPTPPNNTYQFLNGQAAFVTPCITYSRFKPYDNIPFGTTYPAFNTRGSYGLPVLDCLDAVTTDCVFSDIMPQNVNLGSGLTVLIKFTAHTATTGNVRWQVAFGRLNSSIATATFDTAGLVTQATNGTIDSIATATVSALTTINSIVAGDLYVVKVSRLGADAADTMTDTAQLCSVEVRSAGT